MHSLVDTCMHSDGGTGIEPVILAYGEDTPAKRDTGQSRTVLLKGGCCKQRINWRELGVGSFTAFHWLSWNSLIGQAVAAQKKILLPAGVAEQKNFFLPLFFFSLSQPSLEMFLLSGILCIHSGLQILTRAFSKHTLSLDSK